MSSQYRGQYIRVIRVRRSPQRGNCGIAIAAERMLRCAIGRGGITGNKREGDGATPVGHFRFVAGYYRADREVLRPTGLSMTAIGTRLGWCDAPGDRNYNRPVQLPYPASHELMHRNDHLYDWCLVVDQNYYSRIRGRGSAIFVHVAKKDYAPTEGCVAFAINDLRWLISHIGPDTSLVVEME